MSIGGTVTKGQASSRLAELVAKASERETTENALLAGGNVIAKGMHDAIVRGEIAPHTQDQIGAVIVDGDLPTVNVGVTGSEFKVGRFLEFGTSKMQPRPWARPGYEASKDAAGKAMSDELKKDMGL